jgi:hypothetical protein
LNHLDTPVFVINRNRFSSTRRLVSWLVMTGCTAVTVVDNESTYEPLLHYYNDGLPKEVQLVKCGNIGPSAPFALGLTQGLGKHFVITDSDCVPSTICPTDLFEKLHEVMNRYPNKNKVGVSLRIDNLPDYVPFAKKVQEANKGFWQSRISHDCFDAAIDTTFALWRWETGWQGPDPAIGCRLDSPYSFEHWPWYIWPPDEEEIYYAERTLPPPMSHVRQFWQEVGGMK